MTKTASWIIFLLSMITITFFSSTVSSQQSSLPRIDFPSFYEDTIPLESDLDCGEDTALLQRTLQLELAIKTQKHLLFGPKLPKSDEFYTSRILSGDLSDDYTIDHLWFASCNHQHRAQSLWYHFYRRTINDPELLPLPLRSSGYTLTPSGYPTLTDNEIKPIDPGQLFLWLGDALYLDRPPNPKMWPPNSQRSDGTRQLWHKHYCLAIRRQIPLNGMVDDHDYGLNNAHREFTHKYRTKHLFLDFLDLPDPVELGASRQFSSIAKILCGSAIGCTIDNNMNTFTGEDDDDNLEIVQDSYNNIEKLVEKTIPEECMKKIKTTVKDIHNLTLTNQYKILSSKYNGAILDACYVNYNAIIRFDPDNESHYAKSRQFKSPFIFDKNIDLSHLFTIDHHTESIINDEINNQYDKNNNGKLDILDISKGQEKKEDFSSGDDDEKNKKIQKNQNQFFQTTPLQTQTDPLILRSYFERKLQDSYNSRRGRHGTGDVDVYGPLFRRVKTLLIDIRVTAVEDERQIAEPHWKWVKDQLKLSIIPSIEESIWGTNRRINNNGPDDIEGIMKNKKKINEKNENNQNNNDQNNNNQFVNISDEEKRIFLKTLDLIRYNYTKYDDYTGQLKVDVLKLKEKGQKLLLKNDFQCQNIDFSGNNYLKWLTFYENGQFLQNGADILTISSGILISSWGKLFSEGWRTTPGERTRILELSGRTMALSRQNVDEWKIFFESRQYICDEDLPVVMFRDDPMKHNDNNRFNSQLQGNIEIGNGQNQEKKIEEKIDDEKNNNNFNNQQDQEKKSVYFSRVPITIAMKPIAIVYLTGDIHFAEAARTYVPIDLSYPEPQIVSNLGPDVTIQSAFIEIEEEIIFDKYNDTNYNGKLAQNSIRLYSEIINKEIDEIINGTYNIQNVIEKDKEINILNKNLNKNKNDDGEKKFDNSQNLDQFKQQEEGNSDDEKNILPHKSTLFDRYITPLSDITTSGVTHGWGGYSPTSNIKEGGIRSLFNNVLRPKFTNIDYTSKHHWLVDELEYYYKEQNDKKNNNNIGLNKFKINLDKNDFNLMKKQSRVHIYHNIGDIEIDWDYDIIHLTVRNVTLEPSLRFSSKLEHHRAYSLPQIKNFKERSTSYLTIDKKSIDIVLSRMNNVYNEMVNEINQWENKNSNENNDDNYYYKKIFSSDQNSLNYNIKPLFNQLSGTGNDESIRSVNLYLADMQVQVKAESSVRFSRGGVLSNSLIFGLVLAFFTFIGVMIYAACKCYGRWIRPVICPVRDAKKKSIEKESTEEKLRRVGERLKSLTNSGSSPGTIHPGLDPFSEDQLDTQKYARFEDEVDDGNHGHDLSSVSRGKSTSKLGQSHLELGSISGKLKSE